MAGRGKVYRQSEGASRGTLERLSGNMRQAELRHDLELGREPVNRSERRLLRKLRRKAPGLAETAKLDRLRSVSAVSPPKLKRKAVH
jgi:hypothetical protein